MHNSVLGVRKQYAHSHLAPESLDWFDLQFSPSSFHGRFQIGYRKTGERGIWPLFTGDRSAVRDFLETMHVSAHVDYYITANSFSGTKRVSDQLFSLHNIVIDVDAHSEAGMPGPEDFEELLFRMDRDLFSLNSPPPPSSIIRTGRGVQLWWSILPVSSKCLSWYQEICDTMISAIKACLSDYPNELDLFEVDAAASKNPVGFFRLPCTINTSVQSFSYIEETHKVSYNTHALIDWAKDWKKENAAVPERTSYRDSFAGKYLASDIYILKTFHTTAFFRVRQLIQLRLLRDNDVGEETRNNMCFIAYNAMLPALGPEKSWDNLLQFNQGFKQPMTEKELHQTIDTSLKKGGYRYKNETIVSFLGITPQEQAAIGMYEPTEPFSPLTRLSNHPSKKALAKTVKADRNEKIRQLSAAGMNNSKIAAELGIARNTVSAVLGAKVSRKEEALQMLDAGAKTSDIAETLGLSIRTVQLYQKNRKAKFAQKEAYI